MKDTMMKDLTLSLVIAAAGMWAIEAVADSKLEFGNYYLEKNREAASVLDTSDCQATIDFIEVIEDMDLMVLQEVVASSVPSDSMERRMEVLLGSLGSDAGSLEAKSTVCAYYLGRAYGAIEGSIMSSRTSAESK